MADPTCPKCSANAFELAEASPLNSQLKVMFMQCAVCGVVVGVMDLMNLGSLLLEQSRIMRQIAQKLDIYVESEPDAA